ncbi:hypothetical protein ACFE04_000296 [Oxalis oulophora]
MFDCILRTVKEDGVLSLWRGNGSSVLRYYPSVALNFSLKVPYATTVSTILFVSITLCVSCLSHCTHVDRIELVDAIYDVSVAQIIKKFRIKAAKEIHLLLSKMNIKKILLLSVLNLFSLSLLMPAMISLAIQQIEYENLKSLFVLQAAFARAKQNFNLAATSVVLCGQKQMAKE